MARFRLHCRRPAIQGRWTLIYDNATSALIDDAGRPVVMPPEGVTWATPHRVSADAPGRKTGAVRRLKIHLGLSCNYSCAYCVQRFVPRAAATSLEDAEDFLERLQSWFDGGEDGKGKGVGFEFWGGEPFVYWRALRRVVEAIKVRYPHGSLGVITNGSLFTPEIVDWIDAVGISVGISHDGPGQHVRGPDPLADPGKRALILDLYRRLRPRDLISFNAMVNRRNTSRSAIAAYFVELTGDPDVPIGEGAFVDAYDAGGLAESLQRGEAVAFRRRAFEEVRSGAARNFNLAHSRLREFTNSIRQGRPASALGQKCGMDRPEHLAVTLKGEVVTCQNVSPVAQAPNGQPHGLGNVADLAAVEMRTATHWSFRPDCAGCPVLQLCRGACMYLQGDLWRATCDNSYSDAIPFFAAGIEMLTGLIVERIEPLDGELPPDRVHLWAEPAPEDGPRHAREEAAA